MAPQSAWLALSCHLRRRRLAWTGVLACATTRPHRAVAPTHRQRNATLQALLPSSIFTSSRFTPNDRYGNVTGSSSLTPFEWQAGGGVAARSWTASPTLSSLSMPFLAATYGPTGFYAQTTSSDQTEALLQELENHRWIDLQTRVVFIEQATTDSSSRSPPPRGGRVYSEHPHLL